MRLDEYTEYFGRTDKQSESGRLARLGATIREHSFEYLLFLPTLLFLFFLLWVPFLRGIWMSLHRWPLLGEHAYLGLGNYTRLFTWDVFYTSLKVTALFASTTILQLVLALTAALTVFKMKRFTNLVSGLFLIPYTIPPIVTGAMWVYLLNPSLGPVFKYLINLGILDQPIYWGTYGDTALTVITLVTAWTFWPFMFLIFVASLDALPKEQFEAARVFGASRFQRLFKITLPQLKTAILMTISIRIIWNLSKVSQPIQMTGGGPGYSTSVLAILLYRFAYTRGQMGLAYAVGMILLALTLVFIALFLWEYHRSEQVTLGGA